MRKLLVADTFRLRRNVVFYLTLAALLVLSLASSLHDLKLLEDDPVFSHLGQLFFENIPFLGLASGTFIALFLGAERCDGGLRRKLTVGCSRTALYGSAFFTCYLAALAMAAVLLLGTLPLLRVGPFPFDRGPLRPICWPSPAFPPRTPRSTPSSPCSAPTKPSRSCCASGSGLDALCRPPLSRAPGRTGILVSTA